MPVGRAHRDPARRIERQLHLQHRVPDDVDAGVKACEVGERRVVRRRLRNQPLQILAGAIAVENLLLLDQLQAEAQTPVDEGLQLLEVGEDLLARADEVREGRHRHVQTAVGDGRLWLQRPFEDRRGLVRVHQFLHPLNEIAFGGPDVQKVANGERLEVRDDGLRQVLGCYHATAAGDGRRRDVLQFERRRGDFRALGFGGEFLPLGRLDKELAGRLRPVAAAVQVGFEHPLLEVQEPRVLFGLFGVQLGVQLRPVGVELGDFYFRRVLNFLVGFDVLFGLAQHLGDGLGVFGERGLDGKAQFIVGHIHDEFLLQLEWVIE